MPTLQKTVKGEKLSPSEFDERLQKIITEVGLCTGNYAGSLNHHILDFLRKCRPNFKSNAYLCIIKRALGPAIKKPTFHSFISTLEKDLVVIESALSLIPADTRQEALDCVSAFFLNGNSDHRTVLETLNKLPAEEVAEVLNFTSALNKSEDSFTNELLNEVAALPAKNRRTCTTQVVDLKDKLPSTFQRTAVLHTLGIVPDADKEKAAPYLADVFAGLTNFHFRDIYAYTLPLDSGQVHPYVSMIIPIANDASLHQTSHEEQKSTTTRLDINLDIIDDAYLERLNDLRQESVTKICFYNDEDALENSDHLYKVALSCEDKPKPAYACIREILATINEDERADLIKCAAPHISRFIKIYQRACFLQALALIPPNERDLAMGPMASFINLNITCVWDVDKFIQKLKSIPETARTDLLKRHDSDESELFNFCEDTGSH